MRTFLVISLMALTSPAFAQVGKNTDVVNPNLATAEQLAKLPHMSDAVVKIIMDGRPFQGMAKLDAALAKTLSREQLKELYVKLFLPLNLNTAKRPEIMLVPQMGKKMAHEFEEYRPYKKMAQFRREMGKYVDKKEVARFEQYVFVPMNLNTAKPDDFKTIPGMGKRMVHEFMEYRPYKSIKQFRREMGKYVDKKEVARLERYVFVPEATKPKEADL